MAGPTYYDILGVPRDVSPAEVREAYLRCARRLHPDANSGRPPSEAERYESDLRRVNEAWQVLKDPARRRSYDESLEPPPTSVDVDDLDSEFEHADDDGVLVSPGIAMLLRVGPALLLGMVLLGLLIVTAVAGGSGRGGDEEGPERCVLVDSEGAVASSCDAGNGRIVSEVNRADFCPALSVAFGGDRAGVLWCVEMVS